MTIDGIRTIWSSDLSKENESIKLPSDQADLPLRLSAITVLGESKIVDQSLPQRCWSEARDILLQLDDFGFLLECFVSHGPWQPDTRIVRYKRLWKSSLANSIDFLIDCSDDLEIEGQAGVKFCGVGTVDSSRIVSALDFCRQNESCFLFASRGGKTSRSRDAIESIYYACFPNQECKVDWGSLARRMCSEGTLVVRSYGYFSPNQEVAVDIIGSSEMLETVKPLVKCEEREN